LEIECADRRPRHARARRRVSFSKEGTMASELLKGFRMLDLADEKGAMCGKIFADLGADVIKVEPVGGCSTRRIPPFLEDIPGEDRSLYFLAYHAGKRSVTANLESTDGRALVAELARHADFLVESFPLGYLDSIGLGYDELSRANQRLIYASITPFGDKGPAKNYKAADIVTWASGGMMYLMGEEGRPPLQMSLPQSGMHAGAEAAVASLIAHYPRQTSGLGQKIVVDMQACIVWTLMNEQAMPIFHGDFLRRSGVFVGSADARRKMVFRCADGHISILIMGGAVGAPSTIALVKWMDEKGFASDWMKTKDWMSWVPGLLMAMTQKDREEIDELEDRVEKFFLTMTKHEIYREALKRRILLAPVATVADIAADEQLEARKFFVKVDHHDTLGRSLTFPGPFARFTETPIAPPARAPRLGEHNREVYCGLLGLDLERLSRLSAEGAI
jgi:crotonobetainyl-CoA:carnitine CoA-transferase CaiB-like acyl-CoA transferase